jgi:hypothetical protein
MFKEDEESGNNLKYYIIGAIVYKKTDIDRQFISFYDRFYNFFAQKKSAHVYTLGVVNNLRGNGRGFSVDFFQRFIEALEQSSSCDYGLV